MTLSLHVYCFILFAVVCNSVAQSRFQCRSGQMISLGDWCNEKYDCPDGSDEECRPSLICSFSSSHRCSDTAECLPQYRVCDGQYDCPNGEDESWWECSSSASTHWFNVAS